MAPKNLTILSLTQSASSLTASSASASYPKSKPNQVEERQRFWEALRTCLEENRIAPGRSQYYVRWVKEFVDFLPEKRLKARSAEDIRSYLASLAQREGIADWQVRQADMH